jgi:broad specificity phosphatase PhoE
MRRVLTSLLLLSASLPFAVPSTLYFVRHGETLANATGHYNNRTINTFSPKGKSQVLALTQRLDNQRFDAIVVSPSERVLRTIAPYLLAHHLRATVWPELYECCDGNSKKVKGPTSRTLKYVTPFKIPADLQRLFIVQPGHDRLPYAPSYEDGLIQIRATAERLKRDFPRGTVLAVGHSLHGGRLLELLQGKPMVGRIRPENGSITVQRV